jgi:hypothetical protein
MAANNNEGEPFMDGLLCFFWRVRLGPPLYGLRLDGMGDSSTTVPCNRVDTIMYRKSDAYRVRRNQYRDGRIQCQ